MNKHLACKFLIILLLKTRKQIIKMNHNFIARSWYFYWPSLDSYTTKWIDKELNLLWYDPPTMFFWSVIAAWIRRKQFSSALPADGVVCFAHSLFTWLPLVAIGGLAVQNVEYCGMDM